MKTTALKDSASTHTLAADPARQAFLLLRTVFTVAPILFGLDKFTNLLTRLDRLPRTDGSGNIASARADGDVCRRRRRDTCRNPGSPPAADRFPGGGCLAPGDHREPDHPRAFYDVALRDFGLFVGALALNRLATAAAVHQPGGTTVSH
jgi:hypothetical protein